jgi:serine kinase of HPr protein (carbohydrate metabolism regulator)
MNMDATVGTLFDSLQEKLQLQWAGSQRADSRAIRSPEQDSPKTALVGHLNLIHPNQIQVLGDPEIQYLERIGDSARRDLINQLFNGTADLVVVGDRQAVPDDIRQLSEASSTPLLTSTQPTAKLVSYLQYYLTNLFAEKITLHGVFMEVFSLGLLIIGDPSVGKSELALELVARGHRLVADDAPLFAKTAPDILNGRCPDLLRDFLEVRGLGILNIRKNRCTKSTGCTAPAPPAPSWAWKFLKSPCRSPPAATSPCWRKLPPATIPCCSKGLILPGCLWIARHASWKAARKPASLARHKGDKFREFLYPLKNIRNMAPK